MSTKKGYYKKSYKKGTAAKKQRKGVRSWKKKSYSLSRGIQTPFPPKMYTCLRYTDTQTLLPGVGTTSVYTYRLNSLFDPNYTGVGGQPRFFDTLCGATDGSAPYNTYRVYGAKIKLTLLSNVASAAANYVALRWYSDAAGNLNTGSSLNPVTYNEVPNTRWTIVQSYNAAQSIRTLKQYVSMKKMFGVKDIADMDDVSCQYNANPARQCFADIYVSATDGVSQNPIVCSAQIEYYVQFSVSNEPVAS